MKLHTYYLKPHSSFHLGEVGIEVENVGEYAASDRLFSALCTITRHAQGVDALVQLLDRFAQKQPPFLLTGAYPYVMTKHDERLRFFPAPFSLKHAPVKKIRKLRWVSEGLLFDLLHDGLPSSEDIETVGNIGLMKSELDRIGDHAVVRDQPEKYFWRVVRVPRVTVDRVSSASAVYSAGRLVIAPNGGLWCGFHLRDESAFRASDVEHLLNLLSDEGIGGERSGGHGQFECIIGDPLSLPDPEPDGHFMTLSHYYPDLSAGEAMTFTDSDAMYDLAMRRGYMSSPDAPQQYPRQMVRMAVPGSILRVIGGQDVYGAIVDTVPIEKPESDNALVPHPVYRYGFALPVGVKI